MPFSQEMQLLRYQVYRILGRFFFNGPTAETISLLKELVESVDLEENEGELRAGLHLLQKVLQTADPQTMKSWQLAFTSLFLGPGPAPLHLYESVYRSPTHLVMGDTTYQVREFYLEHGVEIKQLNSLPDDHLGAELEFMAYLIGEVLSTGGTKDAEKIKALEKAQARFLSEHLLAWVPNLAKEITKTAADELMRGVALFLDGFLRSAEKAMSVIPKTS
ncbi:MAG: molecular chaperone TorD family protein [Firmicutes bacterium]|nr:molecular chaperone TorD family protein [Bacillota bacterium]MCL5039547.1 molecular chaperone TorD family protein [Bacillota bacterium]